MVTLVGARFTGHALWTHFRLASFNLTHGFRSAQGRGGMVDYCLIRTDHLGASASCKIILLFVGVKHRSREHCSP